MQIWCWVIKAVREVWFFFKVALYFPGSKACTTLASQRFKVISDVNYPRIIPSVILLQKISHNQVYQNCFMKLIIPACLPVIYLRVVLRCFNMDSPPGKHFYFHPLDLNSSSLQMKNLSELNILLIIMYWFALIKYCPSIDFGMFLSTNIIKSYNCYELPEQSSR